MKRDMDLVRLLLLRTDADGVDQEAADKHHAECEKYAKPVRAHHIAIMIEAGLIIGQVQTNTGKIPVQGFILRLTWDGHEFLDAARDDTKWKKVRDKVIKSGASFTFAVIAEALKYEIKSRIGMLPGS